MRAYIITGTSSGLGKAFFDLFVAEGAKVVAIARRFLPSQTQSERVRLVRRDLSQEIPFPKEVAGWLGPDVEEVVFINNAFTDQPIGPAGNLESEELAQAARVNIIAPMLLVNALLAATELPVKLLNISAGAAKRPVAGWGLYCASKAATEMFFDVVALEAHPNVTVYNVNPGVMDTPMQDRIRGSDFPDRERFVAMKEKGELASPADVARRIAAEFLTS